MILIHVETLDGHHSISTSLIINLLEYAFFNFIGLISFLRTINLLIILSFLDGIHNELLFLAA